MPSRYGETRAERIARIKARRKVLKQRQAEYQRTKGSGSPYWKRKAKEYQIKEAIRLRGAKAVEAELKAEYEQEQQKAQTQAVEQWKTDIKTQYPAAYYDVKFVGGEAQITERRVPSEGKPTVAPLKTSRLEAEALAARPMVQRGAWTQPQYKGVTKRYGGLDEPDIPYDIDATVREIQLGWRKESLTPQEFTEKYGPFDTPLGLPEGTRITHVRRTSRGYEMKSLEPLAYDPVKPWGVDKADIAALRSEDRLFTAHLAEKYRKGEWFTRQKYTKEEFSRLSGLTLGIPGDSVITAYRHSPEGYEFQFMPKEEWKSLPSYVKEGREPTFWEVPLYTHLEKGWTSILGGVEKKRKDIFDPQYLAFQKVATGPMRESERQLTYFPIATVKGAESFVGSVEALAGRPSHRSYIPTFSGAVTSTVLSFFPQTQIGPFTIGEGGWGASGKYWEAEMESVKEAPVGMIAGELAFDIMLGYAMQVGLKKAWGGAKWVGHQVAPTVKTALTYAGQKTVRGAQLSLTPYKIAAKTILRPEYYGVISNPRLMAYITAERFATTKLSGWLTTTASSLRTIPGFPLNLGALPKTMLPLPTALAKSVYLPNLRNLANVVGQIGTWVKIGATQRLGDISYQISSQLPTSFKTFWGITKSQPYMFARAVVKPNLTRLPTLWKSSLSYRREFLPGRVDLPSLPSLPDWAYVLKEAGKTSRPYMLAKDVYLPNVLGQTFQPHKLVKAQLTYYREFLPNVALPKISFPDIRSMLMERRLYYRSVVIPGVKGRVQDAYMSFKGSLPKITRPEVGLPDWLYVTKEAGKSFAQELRALRTAQAGIVRWKLHLPMPIAYKPYRAMAPFTSLVTQKTASKTVSALLKEVVKPKVSFAKIVSPSILAPIAVSKLKPQVKTKREKKSALPELVEWKGLEYPSKFAMAQGLPSRILQPYPTRQASTLKLSKKHKEALKVAGFTTFVTRTVQRQRQSQKQSQKQKQKQKQIQKLLQTQALQLGQPLGHVPSLMNIQMQTQRVIQQQAQGQAQMQRQLQKLQQKHDVPNIPKLQLEEYEHPKVEDGLRGRWFKREHKIKSHQEMWETFHSGPRKKRKARKGGVPSWF